MAEAPERLGTSGSLAGPTNIVSKTSRWAIISSITICNTGSSAYTYTLSTSNTSATHDANAYIAYGATIAANDTVLLTGSFVLNVSGASPAQYLVGTVSNTLVRITANGLTGP